VADFYAAPLAGNCAAIDSLEAQHRSVLEQIVITEQSLAISRGCSARA
jgi:hypothetical protein